MGITLDQLLASRDNRKSRQTELLGSNPGQSLVCLTVIMPGSEKRTEESLIVAHAAVQALRQAFSGHISYLEEKDLETGYEAYFITDYPALEAKKITSSIEGSHPLGRLFDADVISSEGVPVPRTMVGLGPRTCLVCGREARWCMRNFTHTQEEIHARITKMVQDYVHGV